MGKIDTKAYEFTTDLDLQLEKKKLQEEINSPDISFLSKLLMACGGGGVLTSIIHFVSRAIVSDNKANDAHATNEKPIIIDLVRDKDNKDSYSHKPKETGKGLSPQATKTLWEPKRLSNIILAASFLATATISLIAGIKIIKHYKTKAASAKISKINKVIEDRDRIEDIEYDTKESHDITNHQYEGRVNKPSKKQLS